jgi:vacuolar-type H+-ATPase subunit H
MRDVIQKVMVTEAEAKRMVQAARSEAGRILDEAQKRVQELTAAARLAAQVETEKILAGVLHAAEAEKQERLARAAVEINTQISVDGDTVRQMAEAVSRCVRGFRQSTRETTP